MAKIPSLCSQSNYCSEEQGGEQGEEQGGEQEQLAPFICREQIPEQNDFISIGGSMLFYCNLTIERVKRR